MTVVRVQKQHTNYQMTEAYRTVRTNLRFCGKGRKVLTITSCMPGEGKSTISMNLALALSEDGANVVLIDADLRKSGMFRYVNVEDGARGLSDYLSGQCELDDVICDTNIKKLKLILSGVFPPNPTELLRMKTFNQMIERLREEYDYVLIDTPPLGYVIDAAVIAESCDGIIWVISSGEIRKGMALEVKEQIDKCGCPILGAVLNKMESKKIGYSDKNYGKYYAASEGKK